MRNKSLVVGSLSAMALTLAAGVVSAHVGYGSSLYDQGTNTFGALNNFTPTATSNAGWISGQSNNGVNRTATVDTLADTHNNRFRFFTLTAPSTVSITVEGTTNASGASVLNPGFSLFSGLVPASSHDGVGNTAGLTPAQITAMQSTAMVGTAANVAGDGGFLQSEPAFASWSPFADANPSLVAEGGGAVEADGANWGVYKGDGNFTMGNNNGEVATATYTGITAGDGHNGDALDNKITWTGNLGPGIYSLVIGGTNAGDLSAIYNGYINGDTAGVAALRTARNMFISMDVNGSVSPVPVPAAIYLFGSGLIGLAGMARRKMTAKG
jgi:hypothetical protein